MLQSKMSRALIPPITLRLGDLLTLTSNHSNRGKDFSLVWSKLLVATITPNAKPSGQKSVRLGKVGFSCQCETKTQKWQQKKKDKKKAQRMAHVEPHGYLPHQLDQTMWARNGYASPFYPFHHIQPYLNLHSFFFLQI